MVVRTDTTDRAAQATTKVATTGTTKDRLRHMETEETRALGEVREVPRPTERLPTEAAKTLGLEHHMLTVYDLRRQLLLLMACEVIAPVFSGRFWVSAVSLRREFELRTSINNTTLLPFKQD